MISEKVPGGPRFLCVVIIRSGHKLAQGLSPDAGMVCWLPGGIRRTIRAPGGKLWLVETGLVFEDLEASDDLVIDLDQIGDGGSGVGITSVFLGVKVGE